MRALIQRVTHANVQVAGNIIGEIDHGILALIGVEKEDTEKNADRLLERILGYRIFADDEDRMNLNVQDIEGGILLVSQFTLVANTKKGMRPSFASAASPEKGQMLFAYLVEQAKEKYPIVASGEFGANMQVSLCNDGPVTFMLCG